MWIKHRRLALCKAEYVVLVDPPVWPAHGRRWAHLVSDASLTELHAFAEMLGAPRRGFDRDHYDIPTELHRIAIWLGATPVSSREVVARLIAAGLRRPRVARAASRLGA